MPDYSKSKIYKLQCEDGHFYIGSTINELRYRFSQHNRKAKVHTERRAYKHINELGWDKVCIILVEEVVCENKQQLRQVEDKHIRAEQENPLCLNIYVAVLTDKECKTYNDVYGKQYRETHKEETKEYYKLYREKNREKLLAYQKAYKLKKKQSQLPLEPSLVLCKVCSQ